jgi:hypothetical protein
MLRDREDAAELLDLLEDQPADWRQYYVDLWTKYPTLASGWIDVNYLNFPSGNRVDDWDIAWVKKMDRLAAERNHQNTLHLAEIKALAAAVIASQGKERARKQRRLDQRLAELGLRPSFKGGARLPAGEIARVRALYSELREVIDCVRHEAKELGLEDSSAARTALLIRYPFFTDDEFAKLFEFEYPRRGATAKAAVAVLVSRYRLPAATFDRYLFPR